MAMGFQFELVLADSLYGESDCNFISTPMALKMPYIGAIRSNHRVWLPQEQEVTAEPWWEIVMNAFTMVSLVADAFNRECPLSEQVFTQHPWWDKQRGRKNLLNNLRVVMEPWIAFNHLKRWLTVFFIPTLEQGFA